MAALAKSLFVVLTALQMCGHAFASSYHVEDRYNPQHISSLPPAVRNAVLRKCPTPRALHEYAEYSNNLRRVTLHFEHFYCGPDDDGKFCGPTGCLHEVYVLSRGRFRLVKTYYSSN